MVDEARARRLAVRIREIVASTLEMQVKDPRLGMVTVTDARVTPDLRGATVYYTVYGDEVARAESAAALESARGVLRSQVGRQTGVKFTPTLAFVADMVPDTAQSIAELLERARDADEQVRRVSAGASHAGDPAPYRVDGELDDDLDGPAAETDGRVDGRPGGRIDGHAGGEPAGSGVDGAARSGQASGS